MRSIRTHFCKKSPQSEESRDRIVVDFLTLQIANTRYSSQDHAQIVHEATGTHLWILRRESNFYLVAVVTWSSWSDSLL